MRTMSVLLALSICGVSAICSEAVDTHTRTVDARVGALQVHPAGADMLPPVVRIGSGRAIEVSFDIIGDERLYLRYNLTHCSADWQPDALVASEYLDGFNDAEVDDWEFSGATTVPYVHYRIVIPDANMNPLLSGNYLLKVYEDGKPDDTLLQARFSLEEGAVGISAQVSGVTDIDYMQAHHQLEIDVDGGDLLSMDDINNRLTIKVRQNSREDDVRTLSRPTYADGRGSNGGVCAHYSHQRPLIFKAGNEYRRFETVSTDHPNMGVTEVVYADPYYHFRLQDDSLRHAYAYDRTQQGRYRVRELNSPNGATGADYAVVHFTLAMPEIKDADVYVDGDLTNRRLDSASRMHYDSSAGVYRHAMLLKQGSYNYQYLVVPGGDSVGRTTPVEGDFSSTVDEYRVDVYYRAPGVRYDRLIGSRTVMSIQ
ncbi:DUF5103 domain-containing protein [uncultured Muribaculum sp.]|uniref:type IX secretion system plug protein n=2 Tax=uncultured Muribaculum sp. TaxID=1918613 RepID=UPI0025F780B6|nr:DUF5103 domain-containing protein [uncultured Muribaculum sp.]